MPPELLIPVADPRALVRAAADELHDAIARVLEAGRYVLGQEVAAFEEEWARYVGVRFCVGVGSGTDALALALRAVNVHPGDEVITVSQSAVATVAAIEQIGAVPVFADIDPTTRCLDPDKLTDVISARTRAILPVHLYGQPAPMESILRVARRHRLKVVEDCAQAHGAEILGRKAGAWGDAAAFSFYPTKNLAAIGDGGAVVSDQDEIAERVRALREYGWKERYVSVTPGVNSRLDELQAAILRVQLTRLDAWNARRRAVAEQYRAAIIGSRLTSPARVDGTVHAMHLFVVETDEREALRRFLHAEGIATAVHYPLAIHQQPAYEHRIRGGDALPVTERLCRRILTLPGGPHLTDVHVERICAALHAWCRSEGDPVSCVTTAPTSIATT